MKKLFFKKLKSFFGFNSFSSSLSLPKKKCSKCGGMVIIGINANLDLFERLFYDACFGCFKEWLCKEFGTMEIIKDQKEEKHER